MSAPNTRDKAEAWMAQLGTEFVTVQFYVRTGGHWRWIDERHVDDPWTLEDTIAMSHNRLGGYALRPCHGRWELRGKGSHIRYYDTREAAEMVAIHNG